MKRLAQQRRKAIDLMKCGGRVLKASMKLVQQRWTGSDRLKHSTTSIHIYEIRLRADKRGVDLTSDVLLLGPLWYAGPNAIGNAIKYAKFFSGSHDSVIRVYDEAGNVIETYGEAGDLSKAQTFASSSPAAPSSVPAKSAGAEAATTASALDGGHELVWVNTEKHVYHREGSRFYGTTKKGKYMTEREAIQTGNKAAARKFARAGTAAALI
jgi:hypothetical protein